MSGLLNTLSGTIYDDIISPFLSKEKKNQRYASYLMKICSFVIGLLSVSLVFVVEKLGGLLPLVMAISGSFAGTTCGLFILAICVPWVNANGALIGSFVSMFATVAVMIGARYHITVGNIQYPKLPLLTVGCFENSTLPIDQFNYTFPTNFDRRPIINEDEVFFIFRLSYIFYTCFGTIVQIVVAFIVSWFTGFNDLHKVNPDLISPVMHWVLPKQQISDKEKTQYKSVEESLEMLKKQEAET